LKNRSIQGIDERREVCSVRIDEDDFAAGLGIGPLAGAPDALPNDDAIMFVVP
jgi:hypothetical protein